jgi:hypothetical protein
MAVLEVSNKLLEELEKLAAEEGLKVNVLAETVLANFVSAKLASEEVAEDEPNLDPAELEASFAKAQAELAAGTTISHEEIKSMAVEILGRNPFKKG